MWERVQAKGISTSFCPTFHLVDLPLPDRVAFYSRIAATLGSSTSSNPQAMRPSVFSPFVLASSGREICRSRRSLAPRQLLAGSSVRCWLANL